jgi:hypothetical protein
MTRGTLSGLIGLGIASTASASFTGFVVTSANVSNSGQNLTVYSVYARFNGPTDTLLNCFNFGGVGSTVMTGFWHKDNATYNSSVLSQEFGTWNPSQTGSVTLNRPFDSYLTVGNQAVGTNTSNADPSWVSGGTGAGAGDVRSWNRPDLPNNGTLGWFNSNPPNNQGRVGVGSNTATDVRIGQFVLSATDPSQLDGRRTYVVTLGYNNGVAGSAVQFATANFSIPAPGAVALLGLAGLAGRRRR